MVLLEIYMTGQTGSDKSDRIEAVLKVFLEGRLQNART